MPVQTPTLVKGAPRRSPSIEFRESPLRSASRAKPTTSRDHHSTDTSPELPTRRSPAAHWRSQLTQEDRADPIELRKKLRLLLVDKFGEGFVPRPVQIEALAGLFQLERFKTRNEYDAVFVIAPTGSGKSLIFQTVCLVYGRRDVTIVVSPLTALSQHHPTISIKSERKRLSYVRKHRVTESCTSSSRILSHTVSFIFISPEMHNGDKRWAELISKDSFRERVKLLAYDEAIKIAEWGFSERVRAGAMSHAMEGSTAFRLVYGRHLRLGCQTLLLTAGAPPYEVNKVSSLSESRTFFAKADLFRPNLRNVAVEMKPRTNGTMGSIRDFLNQRSDPSIFPQSIMYFNSQEATKRLSWVQLLLRSFSL